jgi:glycosyltransferase involved in cell wall biosynthesis
MKNKISIVTPCYNGAPYLNELAESILSQPYENWEWVICDDMSTDNSLEVIDSLVARDSRIIRKDAPSKKYYWWNPQKAASGDIVVPWDVDDKMFPNSLEIINYYFNKFPEVLLIHFNGFKYHEHLPQSKEQHLDNYVNQVYITSTNDSFLEGFLNLGRRSNVFGYTRCWRNIPIEFPEHVDGDVCLSNDGQYVLMLEERGKWLTIPRSNCIVRQHFDSENFVRWNQRGEAILSEQASYRRKDLILDPVRKITYFDEIIDVAECTYASKLNWEEFRQNICFHNFNLNERQKQKLQELFFDHTVLFDSFEENISYHYVNVDINFNLDRIKQTLNNIIHGEIIVFIQNTHFYSNNRTGDKLIEQLDQYLSGVYGHYWSVQDNRKIYVINKSRKNRLKIAQIDLGYGMQVPPRKWGGLEEVQGQLILEGKRRGHKIDLISLDSFLKNTPEYDLCHIHSGVFIHSLKQRNYKNVIYTLHDVHPFLWGKEHSNSQDQLQANLYSKHTVSLSDYYIDWFDNKDNLIKGFVPVDTNYWKIDFNKNLNNHKIICIGANDDRKGFYLAARAAKQLDIPITIVGPVREDWIENELIELNQNWGKLTRLYDTPKSQIKELYKQHTIMVHPSKIETGQPCLSVLEACSSGLAVISSLNDDYTNIWGIIPCVRDVDDIKDKITYSINNWINVSKNARKFVKTERTTEKHWEFYENLYKQML